MSRHVSNAALRDAYEARRRGRYNSLSLAETQILWVNQRRRHKGEGAFISIPEFRAFVKRGDIATLRLLLGRIEEACGYEIVLAGLDI